MKPVLLLSTVMFFLFTATGFAQAKKANSKKKITYTVKKTAIKKVIPLPGTRVRITTDSGVIIVRLYDKTAQHRDNFLKLVKEGFYDSLLFHRVIDGFMIQGGDPESKTAPAGGEMLGKGSTGYTVPAEFDTSLFHKRGALAAARTNNPEKASSGCQFYIVQGKICTDEELDMLEMQSGQKISAAKRMVYKTIGGTPRLDMNYTVFGEVEKGIEVVDKIAKAAKDPNNRPLNDIRMKLVVME
jgi:peptidyl-prolyl cis-trans isomerase B (cyclophilin B)